MNYNQPTATIGPFVAGEKPAPFSYTFQDADGVPIDITGYQARIDIGERDGTVTQYTAVVSNGPGGVATYTWTGAEFPGPGHYQARIWVGNTVQRWASVLILFSVAAGPGPVPSI